jgi:hypothetical protein
MPSGKNGHHPHILAESHCRNPRRSCPRLGSKPVPAPRTRQEVRCDRDRDSQEGQKHPLSSARKCVRGRVCGVSSQAGLFNANWTNRGPPCSGLGQLFHMCMYQRLQKVISSHSHRKSFRSRATALEMCCQETEEPAPREIALRLVVRWEAHLCCARIEAVEGRGRLVHERVACGAPRHLRKCLPGHLVSRRASVRARSKPALGAVGHWCGVGGTGCVAARWAAQRAHPRPGK